MTKNLDPHDPNIKSPLRELDWEDDDYSMEIVSEKLHDRDIDTIFDNLRLLNQRGDTYYSPSMAEAGPGSVRVVIPPELNHLLAGVAQSKHNTDSIDAIRICILHGLSIYEHKIGYDIENTYARAIDAQLAGDRDSVARFLMSSNVKFVGKIKIIRVDNRMYQLLNRWSEHTGCNTATFAGVCLMYSCRTHPKIKPWIETIDRNIEQFEQAMRVRFNILR